MKKSITLIVLLIIIANIYGQQTIEQSQIKDLYIQKSKNQNTAGEVLLISGTVMIVGGFIAFDHYWDKESVYAVDISGYIMLAGIPASLASIPFFISAGINKRKAASLSLNYKNYSPTNKNAIYSNSIPSVTL